MRNRQPPQSNPQQPDPDDNSDPNSDPSSQQQQPTPPPYPLTNSPVWLHSLLRGTAPGQPLNQQPDQQPNQQQPTPPTILGHTPASPEKSGTGQSPQVSGVRPQMTPRQPSPAAPLPVDQEQAIHDRLHSRGARLRAAPDGLDTARAVRQMRDAIARARARFAEQEAHERADRARMRTLFAGDCALCFDTGTNPDTALWCDACERGRDAATRARELADERRRDEWRELLRGANIPPRYWTHSLDSYPWQQSPSLADLREFLTTWDGATGLMLAGDYGRGKTGLIVGAMRQIARDYAGTTRRMLFVPSVSLLDGLRAGYGDSTYDAQMGRLCSVQLLCLDDLAREGISEWARSTLFDILNTRYNAGLPVFVTTNHTLDGLAYRLGEAITQRLEETCIRIEVVGRSLRHAPTLGGR